MPCQGGMSYRSAVVESGTVIDDLTQKLCYLCASLYADDLLGKYGNPEIVKWHQDHMHKDEVRVATEMQAVFRDHPDADAEQVANEFLQKALAVHPVSDYHREWFKKIAGEVAAEIREAKEQSRELARVLGKLGYRERKLLGL